MIYYSCDYHYFPNVEYDKNNMPKLYMKKNLPFYKIKNKADCSIMHLVNYSLFLLDAGENQKKASAFDFLRLILRSQITDIKSEFYGIWLYDISDRTDDFIAPDYLVQANITLILMEIYFKFSDTLPEDIKSGIKNSCCIAAFVNTQHSYKIDSPCIINDILSLFVIGEEFDKNEFIDFAVAKFQQFIYYSLYNNAIMEYNYPERTINFLDAIKYFKNFIYNEYFSQNIESIENLLYECFYSHFNPKNLQWTGPMSSCEFEFLPEKYLLRIQKITNTQNLNELKIPINYVSISPGFGNNFTQKLLTNGFSYPHWKCATVASMYNTQNYSLGSFNRDDLWEFRRPLIAYFGNSEHPFCFRPRCLLNGHDFSSATLHTVQDKGNILGHVTFATNRGNTHINNDYSKTYDMEDLRLRFQLTGKISDVKTSYYNNEFSFSYDNFSAFISINYAKFDCNTISYQLNTFRNELFFDVVLYSDNKTKLNLSELDEAIISFQFTVSEDKISDFPVHTIKKDDILISEQKTAETTLKLETPLKPDRIEYTTQFDRQYINNTRIEEHARLNRILSKHYQFITNNNSSLASILPENFKGRKTYIVKIDNLRNVSIEDMYEQVADILNFFNNLSITVAKRYAVQIITNIFNAAKKKDIRFNKLIETKYYNIFNEINYISKIEKLKSLVLNIVHSLQEDYANFIADRKSTRKLNKIAAVLDIIQNEYSNPNLSLQYLANKIGVSQAHLSREFHKTMEKSYVDYILEIRIEHAKTLLKKGMSLSTVISKCGYTCDLTFNSAFKRYTGTTVNKFIIAINEYDKT